MFKVLRCTLKGWSGRIKVFGHVRYCYYKSLMLPKAVQPKRQEQKQLKESRRTSCLCLRCYRDNSRSSSNTPPTETLDQQRWQLCVNSWLTGSANTLAQAPRGVDSGDGTQDGAFDMYKPSRLPLERPPPPPPKPTNSWFHPYVTKYAQTGSPIHIQKRSVNCHYHDKFCLLFPMMQHCWYELHICMIINSGGS